jgi:hypothetical protein
MKIRIKGVISGTRNGMDWPKRGEEVDFPDDEAAQLCAAGLAEAVKSEPAPPVETATVEEKVETATPAAPLTTSTGPAKRGPGRPRKTT